MLSSAIGLTIKHLKNCFLIGVLNVKRGSKSEWQVSKKRKWCTQMLLTVGGRQVASYNTVTVTRPNFWSKMKQGLNILYVLNSAAVAMVTVSCIGPMKDDSKMQSPCFYFLKNNEGCSTRGAYLRSCHWQKSHQDIWDFEKGKLLSSWKINQV